VRSCRQPVARPSARATGGRRRLLLGAGATLWAGRPGRAAERSAYPAPAVEQERLAIHAATDRGAMEPLLRDFQAVRPGVAIDYLDLNTNELFASVVEPPGGEIPDLVISSAVDLQTKLVNDGWTRPHVSHLTRRLPPWANWRDEAFGFTLEPAVIVHRRGDVADAEAPRSRPELIRLLQERPERFRGRVATYDVAASGVGYLFATQDAVVSEQFWRLAVALGEAGARLLPTTAAVLDAVERGEVLLGYNVLGSYARARQAAGAPVGIVLPRDYTLVMSRAVTIPRAARRPALAAEFIDYLLSPRGQDVVAGAAGLEAVAPAGRPPWPLREAAGVVRTIGLGPELLVFLDPLKRARFLADWSVSLRHP
jgi:two-component system, OmpR family, sensor histidine kinase TctE